MKKILLVALSLLVAGFLNAQNVSPELDSLMRDFTVAVQENNYKIAAETGIQLLEQMEISIGKENPLYFSLKNKVAFLLMMNFQLEEAKEIAVENYTEIKQSLGKEHELFLEAMQILTLIYQETTNLNGLDSLLQKRAGTIPVGTEEYAQYLNSLGQVARYKGNFLEAEQFFNQSFEVYNKVGNKQNAILIYNNLGLLYYEMGLYEKAKNNFEFSIEALNTLSQKDEKHYYIIKTNLANLYRKNGEYSKAEKLFLENNESIDKNSMEYFINLYGLAQMYNFMGLISKAEPYFKELNDISEKKVGKKSEVYLATNNSLGVIYTKKKEYKKAQKKFESNKILISEVYGENNMRYISALNNLADVCYMQGKYESAHENFIMLFKNLQQQIQKNFLILTEKEKFQHIKFTENDIEGFQNFVFDYHQKLPRATGELFNQLLFYKRLILFNTRSFQHLINNSNDPELQNAYRRCYDMRQDIAQMQTLGSKNSPLLQQQYRQADSLEKKLMNLVNQKYPNYTYNFEQTSYTELQKNMKPDEALVEFTRFERYNKRWQDTVYYCALVLRKHDKHPKMVFLTQEHKLQKLFKRTKDETTDAHFVKNLYDKPQKSKQLYNLIWRQLDPLFSEVKTIYLSPTGLLHKVAFDALPYGENQTLSDKYRLHYASSLKNKTPNAKLRIADISEAYLFGAPAFELDSLQALAIAEKYSKNKIADLRSEFLFNKKHPVLSPLPETEKEVLQIQKLLNKKKIKSHLFTQNQATEEAFKSISTNQNFILHLGTHGYYFSEKEKERTRHFSLNEQQQSIDAAAFRSGLYLSGAQRILSGKEPLPNVQDGILTAYEISLQNFENCKMVVLSACQTGLGDVKGHEGVLGLSRAFKQAGAEYVVISLWQVPSHQTQEMMALFYQHLTRGKAIELAFAKAQQTLRKKYKNPYYWAGFKLVY